MATQIGRHDRAPSLLKRHGELFDGLVGPLEVVHEDHGRQRLGALGNRIKPGRDGNSIGGFQGDLLGGLLAQAAVRRAEMPREDCQARRREHDGLARRTDEAWPPGMIWPQGTPPVVER